MEYIHLPLFLVSLAFGLFFVYIIESPQKEIYVFPTPENVNQLQYKDKAGNYFEFTKKELECPTEEGMIEKYIVQ
jgi:hypothetical protein